MTLKALRIEGRFLEYRGLSADRQTRSVRILKILLCNFPCVLLLPFITVLETRDPESSHHACPA